MDVDHSSSSAEDYQMDMMTMMMEMEKLSEPSNAPALLQPSVGYSGGLSPALFCNPSATTSLAPSSIPLGGGHHEELLPPLAPLNSPGGADMWFGGGPRPSVASMREMIFRIAAMQPIHIDPELVKPPKRRNLKISKDPQSVAARHRRERISERIRILQQLVPGGTKMDTASMLDEAIHYMKFLKSQVQALERASASAAAAAQANQSAGGAVGGATAGLTTSSKVGAGFLDESYSCFDKGYEALEREFVMNSTSSDGGAEVINWRI